MPATTVDTLIFRLEVDDRATKNLTSIHGLMGGIGDLAGKAFKGIVDTLSDSMDTYKDYEEALYNVSKTTGMVGDDLKQFADAIKETAKPLGSLTAENLLEVAEVAGQLGITGADNIVEFSKQVGIGAIVLDKYGGSTEKLGTHIGQMQKVFGLSVDQTANMISVLYKLKTTTAATELDVANFNIRMGQFQALMGLSFEESSMWGAMMRDVGAEASKASTQLGSAFTTVTTDMGKTQAAVDLLTAALGGQGPVWKELERLTGQSRENFTSLGQAMQVAFAEDSFHTMNLLALAINNLGITTDNLEAGINRNELAVDAFGKTGLKGMAALGEALRKSRADMEEVQAAFQSGTEHLSAYERLTQRAGEQWNVLGSVMNSIMLTVGEPLVNAFGKFIQDALLPAVNEFDKWLSTSDLMKTVIPEILNDIAAALQEVLKWAVETVKSIDWTEVIQKVYDWYQKLKAEVMSWDWANIWENVKAVANAFFILVKDGLPTLVTGIKAAQDAIALFQKTWENLKGFVEPLFKLFEANFKFFYTAIVEGPIKAIDLLGQAIAGVFPDISGWVDNIGGKLSWLAEKFGGVVDAVRNLGKEAYEESVFPDMKNWIDQNAIAMTGLTSQISGMTGQLNAIQPIPLVAPQVTGGGFSGGSSSRASGSAGRQSPVQGFGANTTNIIFQGTNVVDSASQQRFTRSVTKSQKTQASRTVRGSARGFSG